MELIAAQLRPSGALLLELCQSVLLAVGTDGLVYRDPAVLALLCTKGTLRRLAS